MNELRAMGIEPYPAAEYVNSVSSIYVAGHGNAAYTGQITRNVTRPVERLSPDRPGSG